MPEYIKKSLIVFTSLILVSCAAKQGTYSSGEVATHTGEMTSLPPDKYVPESSESVISEEDRGLYPPEPEKTVQPPTPRESASLKLMEQARMFLDENKPDESIRSLEKAVTISPGRGENYYYLAEAWYMKGNLAQAGEYNSLASIYLKDDARWMELVEEQKERIESSR